MFVVRRSMGKYFVWRLLARSIIGPEFTSNRPRVVRHLALGVEDVEDDFA